MAHILHASPKRRLSARLAAGAAISALLVLGTFVAPSHADERRGPDRDRRGDRGHDRTYYAPPPVVYGTPYYAPPPVVYGPAVGISLPGVNIGIR